MAHLGKRLLECLSKPLRAGMVALQKMEGHALRRLRADAGQTAQCFDQLFETGRRFHFEGSPTIRTQKNSRTKVLTRRHEDTKKIRLMIVLC